MKEQLREAELEAAGWWVVGGGPLGLSCLRSLIRGIVEYVRLDFEKS